MALRNSLTAPAFLCDILSAGERTRTPSLPPPPPLKEEKKDCGDDGPSLSVLLPHGNVCSCLDAQPFGPTACGGRERDVLCSAVNMPGASPTSLKEEQFIKATGRFGAALAEPQMMAGDSGSFGGGVGVKTPRQPLSVMEFEQQIRQVRTRQIQEALSFFNPECGGCGKFGDRQSMADDNFKETHLQSDVDLKKFCNERDVHWFVMSFLSANGYVKALQSFKRHLRLDVQQVERSIYYHQEEHQRQRRKFTTPISKHMATEGESDKVGSLPAYSMSSDDLLLFIMETVRQEQLFDETASWSDVNCQGKDYVLEPLMSQEQKQCKNKVNCNGDNSTSGNMAVGGSVERLIEVLIFSETDAPFTTGIPLLNYTNTFILLSSLFVLPEVLIVRFICLFSHVQQQFLLDDSRRVFLLCRIVHMMIAYCTFHEADITYKVIRRLQTFLQTLGVTSFTECSLHHTHKKDLDLLQTSPTAPSPSFSSSHRPLEQLSTNEDGLLLCLRQLSAVVERMLRRTHILLPDSYGHVCWQRLITAPVKPLGTFFKAANFLTNTVGGESDVLSFSQFCSRPLQKQKSNDVVFTSVSAETLASQMCLLSFKLFASIHLRELLNNAWCDEILRLGVPPHLSRFIDYSSRVERWIAAVIVSPKRWSECRAALRHAVYMCKVLYEKQNYEMAAAVLAGLQNPVVVKLQELHQRYFWQQHMLLSEEDQREFARLKNLMDPFAPCDVPSSFHSVSKRALSEMETPIIPIIAPFLGVLFRTEELYGETVNVCSKSGVSVVNWTKIMALGKLVFIWLRCQNISYEYTLDAKLQDFLWQLPGHEFSDETLSQFILQKKKPRNN